LLSLLLIATLIHNKTGSHWDISLPVTPYNIATHVFLIHNFFPDHFYKIDHVLWSVAVEFQIYFLFPILLACWRTIGAFFTTVIAVVVSSLMEMGATAFFHIGPALHFIGLFALGMSAACIGFSSSRPVFLWGMISIGTFAVFLVMTSIHSASRPFHDVLFGFFAASILIYITITPKGLLPGISHLT
jgi:peptidoglycan/LPS O-acetylase OafA/YrhL